VESKSKQTSLLQIQIIAIV